MWCKSVYPSKKLLYKHLERNELCAEAHYHNLHAKKSSHFTARKTIAPVVARKSFPHSNKKPQSRNFCPPNVSGGSARKTFSSSFQKYSFINDRNWISSSKPAINKCPVCHEEFPDSFNYFQHQKKLNHWGKATKSSNVYCKCPFCDKEFFHIRARNAHLRNHADISEEEIKLFLKNSTCTICAQIFVSESVKQQHMKLEHPAQLYDLNPAVQFLARFSNTPVSSKETKIQKEKEEKLQMNSLPVALKRKLKQSPSSCPICLTDYPSPFIRDKHFRKNHLERTVECRYCFAKLGKGENLAFHMQKFHGETLPYSCRECSVGFVSEQHVLDHVNKTHTNRNPISLVVYQNTLKSLNREEIYARKYPSNEHKLEYYCDICQIGFQKLCGLQRHRQSKQHRDTLVKNLDAVHKSLSNLPPSPPPIPKKTAKQPEIICCGECLEEFSSIKDFVPHRLSHFSVQSKYLEIDELNPYICEICCDEMDNHSKVQHHLFWHLQFETMEDKSGMPSKKSSNVHDRLSGQHVAKKSFSMQSCELLQEVTIGGIKKPLFTCDACSIGFTTKAHYNVHVRRFCRMKKKMSEIATRNASQKITGGMKKHTNTPEVISDDIEGTLTSETETTVPCSACNSLFSSSKIFEFHKEFCVDYFNDDSSSEINIDNTECIKSAIELQCAAAGCITCAVPFSKLEEYAEHVALHHTKSKTSINLTYSENEPAEKLSESISSNENIFHCTMCNCLFSLDSLIYHKQFCDKIILVGNTVENSNLETVKNAMELKCALAGCITCGLPFNDLSNFSNHMLHHHSKSLSESIQSTEISAHNGSLVNSDIDMNEKNASLAANASVEFLFNELAESCSETFSSDQINSSHKSIEFAGTLPCDLLTDITENPETSLSTSSMPIINVPANEELDTINRLRINFSQLLCLLVADPDLMQQLGYGEQLVDTVLVKVLQQMGQIPVLEGEGTDLQRLRKNIQTLLDFCLKDQVLELIASGKTSTDDIVLEALKMFGGENITMVV